MVKSRNRNHAPANQVFLEVRKLDYSKQKDNFGLEFWEHGKPSGSLSEAPAPDARFN